MCSEHCAVCNVKGAVCSEQCAIRNVKFALRHEKCAVLNVKCVVRSVCNIQYRVSNLSSQGTIGGGKEDV